MSIVQRTIHPQVPPKVEYQLTEIGEALRPTLRAFLDWADLIAIDFIIAIPFCNSIHWDWG
jgi:DNA-binding HxlR family transcriptional regulator